MVFTQLMPSALEGQRWGPALCRPKAQGSTVGNQEGELPADRETPAPSHRLLPTLVPAPVIPALLHVQSPPTCILSIPCYLGEVSHLMVSVILCKDAATHTLSDF